MVFPKDFHGNPKDAPIFGNATPTVRKKAKAFFRDYIFWAIYYTTFPAGLVAPSGGEELREFPPKNGR